MGKRGSTNRMSACLGGLALLLIFALGGCSSGDEPPVVMRTLTEELPIVGMSDPIISNPRYLIGPGDVLRINFLGEEQLNANLIITPDGYISVPLLSQPVLASGVMIEDLQGIIQTGLAEFLINPQVFLHMVKLGSQHVFVLGNVMRPHLATSEPLTLAGVIAASGGITRDGQRKQVIVLRRNPDGDPTVFDVNFSELLKGNSMVPDIPLQRYDIVVVPKSRVANARDFMMAVFGNNVVMSRFGIDAIILLQALRDNLSFNLNN